MGFSFFDSLFGSKPKEPEYGQRVWGTDQGKWKGLLAMLQGPSQSGKPVLLLAWFPKTLQDLEYLLTNMGIAFSTDLHATGNSNITIASADSYLNQVITALPANITVWVVEHYPLHSQEVALFVKLKSEAPNATPMVLTSMDEQLFVMFGGDRTKALMAKIGHQEDEVIEHRLVKASVVNAQKKVAQGVISEVKTQTDQEWFTRNYTKS